MSKRIVSTIVILIITISTVNAQKNFRNGYILTSEKDTIQGEVVYRSNAKNYQSCIFKSGQTETEYFPNQILGFGYSNDKFFSSEIVEDSFAEVLVTGRLSLYRSMNKYHIKKDAKVYDLESTKEKVEIDGKVGNIERSRWRGTLTYLISDCLENSTTLTSKISLEERSLTRLVLKYNECSGEEFEDFKASQPWTKVELGVTVGASNTVIKVKDKSESFAYLDDSYSSLDPSAGILIAISSPRLSQNLAFQAEFHFIKSSFSSLVELDGPNIEFHDTFIDLNTLSIPLSLKYSIPGGKYGLYFQTGVNFDYQLSSETRLLTEQVVAPNSINTFVNTFPETSAFEVDNSQFGYWVGLGILRSFRKFSASIALRYFRMSNLNSDLGFDANINRFSLNLILFK